MITDDEIMIYSILGSYLSFYSFLKLDPNLHDSFKSHMLEESKKIKDDELRASLENIVRAENIKITPHGVSLNYNINSN